ncbi:MAG: hypothetical protein RLZZ316_310 [Bacteroidota bacterium]|jgi:thiol-disulfide isomerase/thioredoxin
MMKKSIALLTFFVYAMATATAQSVEKMNINQLKQYIDSAKKPVVISFWATWCASCNEEIPYFISTLENNYKDSVELLLVSLDFKDAYPSKIAAFAKKRNYKARLVWLNETNADYFCPVINQKWSGSIPANYFVNNKSGYQHFYERGLTLLQLEAELKKMVATKGQP